MRILRMTATFGRLEQETLALQGGLNVLQAPNESGKSTWSAFLLAMLYGVPTSERSKKGSLPFKEKYRPWSGKPMAGRMELLWDGREITLVRTTKGRTPMGEFSAFETAGGLPVRELTAENCGRQLLGVEQSVFERSAFLGQSSLAIGQDADLERRLAALTATGEETVSYTETEQRLRDWKNRCRHNKTGLLPQAEEELRQVQDLLEELHLLNRDSMSLRAEEQRLTAEDARLAAQLQQYAAAAQLRETEQTIAAVRKLEAEIDDLTVRSETAADRHAAAAELLRCLDAEARNARLSQLRAAEAQWNAARKAAEGLEKKTAGLPERAVLDALLQRITQLAAETAALPDSAAADPQSPMLPAGFRDRSEEEIRQQTAADVKALDALRAQPRKTPLWWLAIALLASAVVCLALLPPVGAVLLAAAVAALSAAFYRRRQEEKAAADRRQRMERLLQKYDVASRDEILTQSTEAIAALQAWRQACDRKGQERAELDARMTAIRAGKREIAAQIQGYAGVMPSDSEAWLQSARQDLADCAAARQQAQLLQRSLRQMQDATGKIEEVRLPEGWITGQYDRDAIGQRCDALQRERNDLAAQLQQLQGRRSAMADLEELQAQRERLREAAGGAPVEAVPGRAEAAWTAVRKQLETVKGRLHEHRGLVSGKGDPAVLGARAEQLQTKIAALQEEYDALSLAAEVLSSANDQMQRRFAPQLGREAAVLLKDLTGGRYERVFMDRELAFRAQECGALDPHALLYLSCGAADQLYFAVRLALCRLMLRADTPLVLDDALVNFDDDRADRALRLLEQEAKTRQILLFTCHDREKHLLHAADPCQEEFGLADNM
ncbi:MAG: AAA family ATPase [Oscillospiraceae bacterium]|nr:AAA family ATPase [Oscillospiraceae bacterium]